MLAAAAAMLLGPSVVVAQADQGNPKAGQCRVVIDRSQNAGVFDVTRQSDDDGNCICYAYTGPDSQDNATESKVTALEESKRCPDAKVMAVAGPAAGAAAAGGSGFLAGPLAPLLAVGALGGGAAAAASGSGDNGAPVSP